MNYFYTDRTGAVVGPVSREKLQKLVDEGTIGADCQACPEGSEVWQALTTVIPPKAKEKPQPIAAKLPETPRRTDVPADERSIKPEPHITRLQGYAIIILLCIGLGFPFLSFLKPAPRWEYKKVVFLTDGQHDRTGYGALSYSSIKLDEDILTSMGSDGWELATSYLEMETAFPNFGKEDYVTGLQPNIRPQSLVLIFKRPK